MPSLQEQQQPVDIAIVNGIVASTPEHWKKIVMEATRRVEPNGTEGITIILASPEGYTEMVSPKPMLIMALRHLSMLFAENGNPWSKVAYRLVDAGDGNWSFKADFEY
ncbi:MAG: hypothetical protein ABSA78_11620 [Candidatus Sulfotelmatobacter sp.]|jgi:hypothetical protein